MSRKSTARRHHFVPQAYLARFTDSGTKDGYLFAIETDSGRAFRTTPRNVAVEQDFNRIDAEGYPPDFIENALAPLEQAAVEAIGRTISSGTFPSDEDYSAILYLLGLLFVRNPQLRKSFNTARAHSAQIVASVLVSKKEIYEHHVKKTKDSGEEMPDSVSYEDVKRFVEDGDFDIEFHPQSNLRVEFNALEKMLHILHERDWSLIVAPPDGPEFICCDHPVALAYKTGRDAPIGLASRNSEIFFPLSPRFGFYGTYEDALMREVNAKPGNVATMNLRVANSAMRHIFSARQEFSLWMDGETRVVRMDV